ncbi:hypothetical protein LTR64_003716 [Lithohypha guttulata]|uniref:uncharacterized protein n=1 Tax=Lithohypha guttulata TaxID=1690604 RepID=UPI002DE11058|nr:hypothetical protein LTR51_000064 [Lithohypha guttulata]
MINRHGCRYISSLRAARLRTPKAQAEQSKQYPQAFPIPSVFKQKHNQQKQPKPIRDFAPETRPAAYSPFSEKTLSVLLGEADEPDESQSKYREISASSELKPSSRLELRSSVELSLSEKVPTAFGLPTEKHIVDANPTDFFSFLPAYLARDDLKSDQIRLLWSAVRDILPPDPLNPSVLGPKGNFTHRRWHKFRDNTTPDLATNLITNRPAEIWPYRLWSSGAITQHENISPLMDHKTRATQHMIERPTGLRVEGTGKDQKSYVTIGKSLFAYDRRINYDKDYTVDNVLELFKPVPTDPEGKGTWLEEQYTLCFLRTKPKFLGDPPRLIKPPTSAKFSHTLIPSRHLLFCWSAATNNAHLIHLDPGYARRQYGARNLIVHGPLTVFLMLEWFTRTLTRYAMDRLPDFQVKSIEYRNLQVLYVDAPMTLCAKPTEFPEPGSVAPRWDVWIEKKSDDGAMTIAFKGQIVVRAFTETSAQGGEEFQSPFFGLPS